MLKKITSKSARDTEKIGEEFAQTLKPGDVVCLYGGLGAGKTTFAKGVAKGLGIKSRIISPTFSLIRKHSLEVENLKLKIRNLYHIDLYRLENEDQIKGIGIQEILFDPNVVVLIEWAERMKNILPKKRIEVFLNDINETSREIMFNFLPEN